MHQQQQQQHTTTAQLPAQLWSKQLNGVSLSRKHSDFLYAIVLSLPFRTMIPLTTGASSNSSSIGASPARPPKSDRRRSSASPESVLQYTMSSPTASPPVPSSSSIATIAAGAESPVPTASPSSTSATRSSRLSNLSMASASPVLPSIKAGSTPVTPNVLSFQEGSSAFPTGNGDVIAPSLQRNTSTSTAELLSSTLDSYHNDLSREPSSASSSRYSSSVPPSPAMSPAPVASFTAGLNHQLSPTLGPLRIESTTGSKATVIRPDKKKLAKGRTSRSASGRGAFQGGISSEDIFGSNTESNDDGVLSDVPSHTSSRRSRTFSVSSRGKNKKSESQGISSDDVFGRTASPSSPKMPSLANMLTGLRRQSSRPDSRSSSRGVGGGGGDHSSRASSSRHSQSNASMSASASERESVMSDKSRNSSNGKRRNRFSDVLKRKTDADRAEEEEHLRVLAELRLKALALASAPDTQYVSSSTSSSSPALGSRSNERTNAELLVRDMEKHRLSRAESTSSTYSSNSAAAAAARNDDTITSPLLHVRSRASSHSSFEHDRNREDGRSSSAAAGLLLASDRPSADVPFDADESDEDARDARKSFAATGRRATLMPTGSYSSISDSEDHTMPSHPFLQVKNAYADGSDDRRLSQGTVGATAGERRRSTLTPAHTLPSEHMKAHKSHHKRLSREYGPTTGTEADIEDEENPLTSSVLDRRRSTIKVGQDPDGQTVVKKSRSKSSLKRPSSRDNNDQAGTSSFIHRPERTSAIIVPQQQYPTRPRNQSLSSSQSIRNINAEAVLPPVRSSSRTDSPPIRGLPLEQRSISLQSLSQRLADPHVLSPSTEPTLFNVPSALSMSSRHAREGASVSARVSEPGSPTSPSRKFPVDSTDRLTEDIMAAMQQTAATTASSRRSSAEQAKRGSAPRPDLGYHRRSSSDMLALMAQQRQRPAVGHHRRSSSSIDANQKALPARPASSLQQQKRLSASIAKIQSQQYAKLVALLTRNKPLPAAAQIKEEIRSCRSAGERAVLYARKINELAMVESGLEQWLSRTQPSGKHSARVPSSSAEIDMSSTHQLLMSTTYSGLEDAAVLLQYRAYRISIRIIITRCAKTTTPKPPSRSEGVRMTCTKRATLPNARPRLHRVLWYPITYHIQACTKTRKRYAPARRCPVTRHQALGRNRNHSHLLL